MFLTLRIKFDYKLSDFNILVFGGILKVAPIMHEIPTFHVTLQSCWSYCW
jgi:hypothetical protein